MVALLRNYLTIAWRNFLRYATTSLLNGTGLLVGIVTSLFIFGQVWYETSYDTFQPHYQDIYRIVSAHYQQGVLQRETAFTVPALGPRLVEQVPGVTDFFRVSPWAPSYTLTYRSPDTDPVIFKEKQAYFSDAAIISHFGLALVQGNPQQALTRPAEVILSVSTAQRYFGATWKEQNIIGKTLDYHDAYQGQLTVTIAGVFTDYPANSHLQFDVLFSHRSLPMLLPKEIPPQQRAEMFEVSWGPPTWYTYVVLDQRQEMASLVKKINTMVAEQNTDPNKQEELVLQPIESIHLYSNLQDEPRAHGDALQVEVLSMVGVLLLLIAWINYINLTMIGALSRAKEVALRKVFSASRGQLVKQFVLEAFLSNALLILVAALVVGLLYPWFVDFMQLDQQPSYINQPFFWIILIALLVGGTLVTGLYPGGLLSKFTPLVALKGIRLVTFGALRRALVVFQVGAALLLMVITLTVVSQLAYMQRQGAGITTEETLVIEAPNVFDREGGFLPRLQALRAALEPLENIEQVTATNFIPGSAQLWNVQAARLPTPEVVHDFKQINVDDYYLSTIEARFVAGVNFSELSNSESKIIVNRAATQLLGFQEPDEAIKQTLRILHGGWTSELEIVGVIENYHHYSLENAYQPILFFPNPDAGNILVKFSATTETFPSTVAAVRQAWNRVFLGNSFEYFLLQDFYKQQYQSEERFSKAFTLGTVVAIFVALLGLVALITLITLKKQQEIGIRKALGASTGDILRLLTQRLILLIVVSCAIALPVAYWLTSRWLDNYAFRIDLASWLFIVPTLTLIALAVLTLLYHTWKAARSNPTQVLRYE